MTAVLINMQIGDYKLLERLDDQLPDGRQLGNYAATGQLLLNRHITH
jgi:hypothetical protein